MAQSLRPSSVTRQAFLESLAFKLVPTTEKHHKTIHSTYILVAPIELPGYTSEVVVPIPNEVALAIQYAMIEAAIGIDAEGLLVE